MTEKQKKLTRVQRGEKIRRDLISAGAEIVGAVGYADASISRICERAGIAQGTFYNYFESRQEFFDLLPIHTGERMLAFISESMQVGECGVDREVRRLDAFLRFCQTHTEAARLVNEAPILAPDGYAKFYRIIREGYGRAITRSIERGEMGPTKQPELYALVDLLVAIRNGLSKQLLLEHLDSSIWITHVLGWYRGFVENVVFASEIKTSSGSRSYLDTLSSE